MKRFRAGLTVAALLVLAAPFAARAQYAAVNGTLSLGGGGWLSVPFDPQFNASLFSVGQVSIDAWVRPAAIGADMAIVGNDASMSYWFGVTAAGKLRFRVNPNAVYESAGTLAANAWTHVAASLNTTRDTLRFYINGALDRAVLAYKQSIGLSQGDLRIGADRGVTGGPATQWNGQLDEVRMWSVAIDFSGAEGLLHRVPHAVDFGRFGRFCIAAWRLNGNGLDHARGHDATPVGGVSWPVTPLPPHYARIGAQFNNGNNTTPIDVMSVAHAASLAALSDYTVEGWVKPFATGGASNYQTIACKGDAVSAVWAWWLGINKGNGRLRFVPAGNMGDAVESAAALPTGAWSHVAARFRRNAPGSWTATLFVNGAAAGARTYTGTAPANTSDVLLGCASNARSANVLYGLSGILDELRLWNVARTDAEIQDNHLLEFSGPRAGLAAAWRFDGDGDDASGLGNHVYAGFSVSDLYFVQTPDLPPPPTLALTAPNGGESWTIGASRQVRWNSTGLAAVCITLSRDGGNSWPDTLAAAAPAAGGVFTWTVTGPPTVDALLRVATRTPTGIEDVSNAVFEIVEPPPFVDAAPMNISAAASRNGAPPAPVRVQLANTGGQTLNWYVTWSSMWLSASPSSGSANSDYFDVSFLDTSMPEGTYTDTLVIGGNAVNAGLRIPVAYRITAKRIFSIGGHVRLASGAPLAGIGVASAGETVAAAVSDSLGAFTLVNLPSGDYTVAPGSRFFTFTPPSRSYTPLNNFEVLADFTAAPAQGRMRVHFRQGWNLLSLPLIPADGSLAALFPSAESPAYAYDPASGYLPVTALEYGKGYWVKFPAADSVDLSGTMQRDETVALLAVSGGWNMIGAPGGPAPLAAAQQLPAGAMLAVYEYDPMFGYFPPLGGVLRPGHGYFVKAGVAATVLFIGTEAEVPSSLRALFRQPDAVPLPRAPRAQPPSPPDGRE